MRTIYKYPLTLGRAVQVEALGNGKIVHVGLDASGEACVWLDGDSDFTEARWFYIHGTGHPIHCDSVHVGSFVDAPFVWHLYEIGWNEAQYHGAAGLAQEEEQQ